MRVNRVLVTLTLGGLMLVTSEAIGQEQTEMSKSEHVAYDSVQTARHDQMIEREQKENDAEKIAEAKDAQQEASAKAKETRRIDREANRAAREAKLALRSERKAQKARKDADQQSRKAAKAKDVSDEN